MRLIIFSLLMLITNISYAIPLPSETSDLVLVCRGFSHWPHYKNIDEDNVIIINYQNNKVYWYGDITNKRLFNELNISDEKRTHTWLGGNKEIINITTAIPGEQHVQVGRIVKTSSNDYISATIGDYSFRARCVFYSPEEYNRTILPQLMTTGANQNV